MKKNLRGLVPLLFLLCFAAPMITLADTMPRYHGTIVDEEGKPLADVSIKVMDQTTLRVGTGPGNYLTTFKTNSAGNFSFYLDWGTYELTLIKEGYVPQTLKYSEINVLDLDMGTVIMKRSISLSLVTSKVVASPGSRLTIALHISNGGTTEESIDLETIVQSHWAACVISDAGEIRELNIKAGSTVNLELLVDVPSNATTAEVKIIIDGQINISKTLTVLVEGEAVRLIACSYPSKISPPGEAVSFRIIINNPTEEARIISLNLTGIPVGWSTSMTNDDKDYVDSIYLASKSSSVISLRINVPTTVILGKIYELTLEAVTGTYFSGLDLVIKIEYITSTLIISSKYPSQSIQLGVATVYPVTLKTDTSKDLIQLSAAGVPEGWSVAFKTQDGRQINSILMDAESTEILSVAVTPSLSSKQGRYNLTLLANGTSSEGRITLTADITGSYSLAMELDSLYIQTKAQNSDTLTVKVTNKGYSSLTNVLLDLSYPDGWSATFSPLKVTTLNPNESTTFLLTITIPEGASPKDYLASVQASSSEVSATAQTVRVTVNVESSWMIYGIILLVLATGAFVILYRKIRRR